MDANANGYGDVCEPNNAPRAIAGPDQTAEAKSPAGATVTLNGSASTDRDGDQLTFTWTGPFGTLVGEQVNLTLSTGTYTITLTVTDSHGASSSDTINVRVGKTLW